MKETTVKVVRRFTTDVQYEYVEIEVTGKLDAKEDLAEVTNDLITQIEAAVEGEPAKTEKTEKPKSTKETKNGKTNPAKDDTDGDEDPEDADATEDGESTEDDEAADDEASGDSDDSADTDDSGDEGEEAEEKKKSARVERQSQKVDAGKKTSGDKKGFRKKPQVYNREIKEHREIFSKLLGSVSPKWAVKKSLKDRARKASEEFTGEEFLDENGTVLPAFKTAVKDFMEKKD